MGRGLTGTDYGNQANRVLPNTKADGTTGSTRQITELHSHIHEGLAFEIYKSVINLANNAHTYFEIKTPPEETIHLKNVSFWISEGPILIKFIEAPTLTTGATPFVPVNLNRNLKDGAVILSGAVVKINPTGISGGIEIKSRRWGVAGLGAQTNESFISSQIERVLRFPEITYLIDIQNLSGDVIDFYMDAVWYE